MEIINKYKNDIIAISALISLILIITYLLLNIDLNIGVYYIRDVFGYLNNALFFAGYNSGLPSLRGLSPAIPLITSLFFRMGFVSDGTILIVSSSFYVLSTLGIYLLLRLRFNEILSFTGGILLATFPINLVWATKGMLDVPGLCVSIWSVYFMMLSLKKNPKFLYITIPLIIFGFFIRYTVALIIPVLAMQFLLNKNPFKFLKKNLKHIIIAIILGIITLGIFIGIYNYFDLPMFFISQTSAISSANAASQSSTPHPNNIFYYLNNLLIYIGTQNFIPYSLEPGYFSIFNGGWSGGSPSPISYILCAISLIGIGFYLKKLFDAANRSILNKNTKMMIIISSATLLLFLITFTKISILISLILLSISMLSTYHILYKTEIEYLDLDFIFLYWFIVNFVFFTYHQTKVDRYAITFTPFITYLIILSLDLILNKLNSNKYSEKIKILVPIGLICGILLCSGIYALSNEPHTFDNQVHPNLINASNEEKNVGAWLINHDANYSNKTIWADRGGDMSFILQMQIPSLEKYSNSTDFTEEMLKENVTYFITEDNKTFNKPYEKLYQCGEVSLYGKNS